MCTEETHHCLHEYNYQLWRKKPVKSKNYTKKTMCLAKCIKTKCLSFQLKKTGLTIQFENKNRENYDRAMSALCGSIPPSMCLKT